MHIYRNIYYNILYHVTCKYNKFMVYFSDGEMADLGEQKYPNIHVVTGALKLYLRILPVPLITFKVHPLLLDATRKIAYLFSFNLS